MSVTMITSSSTSRIIDSNSPVPPVVSVASTSCVSSAVGGLSSATSTIRPTTTTISPTTSQIQQKSSGKQELSSIIALPLVTSTLLPSSLGLASPAAASTITTTRTTDDGLAAPALSILLSAETPATATAKTQSHFIVGTHTVTAGAQEFTVFGTVVSDASSATELIIGSSTILPLQTSPSADLLLTLKPGGPAITLSDTLIGLATSTTKLVVGSSTIPLFPRPERTTIPDITLGSTVLTPDSDSVYTLGSQILSPGGPAITVSGTEYTLATDGGELLVGSSTEVLTTTGTGVYVWSNIGASSISSGTLVSPASTTTTSASQSRSGVLCQQQREYVSSRHNCIQCSIRHLKYTPCLELLLPPSRHGSVRSLASRRGNGNV
ncbi:hypothetical protein LTR78_009133 [Recurvomyces mirabilis]|uniref:Uncharacterized protein n=1 Tax=Recurvomyces mirabilis TaxID=574656 RepID=A0AAE0TPX1_9PEZI|nr:hypothetical protein LTR78_009133 [Recurvomyces mirabilis]KAK5161070.1 hypothetical protein LTS14_000866 [Recurvomyces mirabilis]